VIPSVCEITVDSRILPGVDPDAVVDDVRRFLGDGPGWELEPIERRGGTRSPASGPLWEAVVGFVAEEEPEAFVVPFCAAGFTDSHWMRSLGAVAYGFFPSTFDSETAARLIHSADERVPVEDLDLGVRYLRFMARAVCG
jgi:acetylornithine deacetylase/succinyl-diaminopimelate desuccinylase-like protein